MNLYVGAEPSLHAQRRRTERLLAAFRLVGSGITLFLMYKLVADGSLAVVSAMIVAVAALLPAYLWCSGRVPGVPLFPLFALTYLWTYAYPLASGHPIVAMYSDEATLVAGMTVAAALLVGLVVWFLAVRTPYRPRGPVLEMKIGKGDYVFCAMIILAGLLTMSVVGQWFELTAGIFSILRAALFGLCAMGIFALSYRMGSGQLRGGKKTLFILSLVLYVIAQTATLFLVSGIVATVLAAAGYATGSRRIPWAWTIVLVALFTVLHAGKGDLRDEYWYPTPLPIQPWEYPALFAKWGDNGLRTMASPEAAEMSQPVYERVSLVHLLLKIQDESPEQVPYLLGESYVLVPGLLVPRIFSPDKGAAHAGTTLLSAHYGLQVRDESQTTTIGWGLLNEVMANFGPAGILIFGIVTGYLYGWITKVTANAPILSLRMLVAITFMAFAVQTEFTAGVYASALFQSLVALFAMSFFFMERKKAAGPDPTLP